MAPWRTRLQRAGTGRDVLALYLLILGFVTLALLVDESFLGIPGTIFLLGFDVVQTVFAPGITGIAVDVARAMYLYVLAVAFAFLYRAARTRLVAAEA
jgi:hypothetical protein